MELELLGFSGCNRGYVSKHITLDSVEELILCDVSKANLENVVAPEGVRIEKKILDEENINVSNITGRS